MMTQDELLELMTAVLDGNASPQEEARLTAHLKSNPEARRFFEEAREGTRALETEGLAEMPRGLQSRIRDSLRHDARQTQVGWWAGWLQAFRSRPALGLVPAFATGAAAGILIFSLLTGGGLPKEDGRHPVSGTMSPLNAVERDVTLGRVDLGAIEAAAWTDGARVAIHLDVFEEYASPLELVFYDTGLQVQSIRWPCDSGGEVQSGEDWVIVTANNVGCCEVVFRLTENAAAPERMIFSGDREAMKLILRAGS